MVSIVSRRTIVCALGAAPFAASGVARAQAKTGLGVYPVAVPGYQVMFVAEAKGYLKDEGYDFKLIQGGSGTRHTPEVLWGEAAERREADLRHLVARRHGASVGQLLHGEVRPGRRR